MIFGYSITREYRLLTVYKFTDANALLAIARYKPAAHMDRVRRWLLICQQLRSYKIPTPQYFPPAAKGKQPRSPEHHRAKWIAEHLDEFPLGHIAESQRKMIVERMKQAGLFASSTYWRDAWRSIDRMLGDARLEVAHKAATHDANSLAKKMKQE